MTYPNKLGSVKVSSYNPEYLKTHHLSIPFSTGRKEARPWYWTSTL